MLQISFGAHQDNDDGFHKIFSLEWNSNFTSSLMGLK
jgi:hypothetical protein